MTQVPDEHRRKLVEGAQSVSRRIVMRLLGSLRLSTFNDLHPEAFKELLKYQEDMEADVFQIFSDGIVKADKLGYEMKMRKRP